MPYGGPPCIVALGAMESHKVGVDRRQKGARRSRAAASSVETADEGCDLLQGRNDEDVLWWHAVSDSK